MIATGRDFVRAARRVREHLGQRHRWAHTLGVARVAERLAAAHGIDTRRARIAGLLHDLARLYPGERLLRAPVPEPIARVALQAYADLGAGSTVAVAVRSSATAEDRRGSARRARRRWWRVWRPIRA